MTRLAHWGVDPFDLLWKNLFDQNSNFSTIAEKVSYPLDIYEKEDGIVFELAAVGLDYSDIDIEVQGDILRIKYSKPDKDEPILNYLHKGIARRSFDLAWKVATKFDLKALEASIDKGLLKIEIPVSKEAAPKRIQIKPKTLLQVNAQ
jgi:HSP20 family molecular chaperone IbpA